MIIYEHIKTKAKISLDEIKEKLLQNPTNELHIHFEPPIDFVNGNYIERLQLENYTYRLKDIPLSNDFKLIKTDDDFTLEELYHLAISLRGTNIAITDNRFSNLQDKLYRKIEEKRVEQYDI